VHTTDHGSAHAWRHSLHTNISHLASLWFGLSFTYKTVLLSAPGARSFMARSFASIILKDL